MKEFDFTDIENEYVRITSNGAVLHLWVKDGAIEEVSVHRETPQVNIWTTEKMAKKTRKISGCVNNCITLRVIQ